MADKTIKQLTTEITAPSGDDVLPIQRDDDGVTGKIKVSNINPGGWLLAGETWDATATGYNNGAKEYEYTISADVTSKYSNGMRIKWTRGTAAGSQSLDLERSSSQYASKSSPSGITFTTAWSAEAWIKMESYAANASGSTIISRFGGSNTGFIFRIREDGVINAYSKGSGIDDYRSTVPVPLGKWVHVAVTATIGGTHAAYINGQAVDFTATSSTGTSITQAGDLSIGTYGGATDTFDGKIKDVRLWDSVQLEIQIQDKMNKELVGNEGGLVGYWKLEGDYTDETSNSNDLTASGSPTFDSEDSPFNATEYGIIESVVESGGTTTITVDTGDSYNIPPESITTGEYSSQYAPQGLVDSDNGGADITVADKSITGLKMGTPVAFRGGPSGSQSISNESFETMEIETVQFDYGNNMSGNRFIAPYDGIYWIGAQISISNVGSGSEQAIVQIDIDDGSGYDEKAETRTNPASGGHDVKINVSTLYKLNAGDLVRANAYQSTGTSANLGGIEAAGGGSWFSVYLIGRID